MYNEITLAAKSKVNGAAKLAITEVTPLHRPRFLIGANSLIKA